ncbi:hypothetical protein CYMTET_32851 [Cymbomonas tetramitiformis]|uniref:RING-type domain-containing protein n=1 Tax=Cymbomonas tetramitiformis TaxID=36881 RepID=A0AAE0FEI2_9CHLO|nr:hypothetical protein CYMTET_32851 [Cymbomonas tetramitiformis]
MEWTSFVYLCCPEQGKDPEESEDLLKAQRRSKERRSAATRQVALTGNVVASQPSDPSVKRKSKAKNRRLPPPVPTGPSSPPKRAENVPTLPAAALVSQGFSTVPSRSSYTPQPSPLSSQTAANIPVAASQPSTAPIANPEVITPRVTKRPSASWGLSFSAVNLVDAARKSLERHEAAGNVQEAMNDLTNLINLQQEAPEKEAVKGYLKTLYSHRGRDMGESCSICLEDFDLDEEPYEPVEVLHGCYHCFHADCVNKWRKVQKVDKRSCPECRHRNRSGSISD